MDSGTNNSYILLYKFALWFALFILQQSWKVQKSWLPCFLAVFAFWLSCFLALILASYYTLLASCYWLLAICYHLVGTSLLTGCPKIKFTSCTQFYKEYKVQKITKIFMSMNARHHFERFLQNSIHNLFSSPQHPIPASFFVHCVKENNFLLLIF